MSSRHVSLRIDVDLLDRLEAESRRRRQSRSEAATTLLDEGLRMEAHLGIVFRSGLAGRRPALTAGPDDWEIVRAFRSIDGGGDETFERLAEQTLVIPAHIHAALRYYADHQPEIDGWIEQVEAEALRAEAAWRRQQLLWRR